MIACSCTSCGRLCLRFSCVGCTENEETDISHCKSSEMLVDVTVECDISTRDRLINHYYWTVPSFSCCVNFSLNLNWPRSVSVWRTGRFLSSPVSTRWYVNDEIDLLRWDLLGCFWLFSATVKLSVFERSSTMLIYVLVQIFTLLQFWSELTVRMEAKEHQQNEESHNKCSLTE